MLHLWINGKTFVANNKIHNNVNFPLLLGLKLFMYNKGTQTLKWTKNVKYELIIICYWRVKKWIICSKGIHSRVWIDTFDQHLIDTQSTCWLTLDWHLINILVKLWSRVPQTCHHSTVYQYSTHELAVHVRWSTLDQVNWVLRVEVST